MCTDAIAAASLLQFQRIIEANVPTVLDIHLVLGNCGTHKTPAIKSWLARHPRFQVHFTPTSASWLNQVERWFATLTQKCIRRGSHRSTHQLEQAIKHYIKINNSDPKPFVWSKTADEILASIERFVCELLAHNTGPRPRKMYTVPVWPRPGGPPLDPRLDRLVRPRLAADRATVCTALNKLREQPAGHLRVADRRGQMNSVRDRAMLRQET